MPNSKTNDKKKLVSPAKIKPLKIVVLLIWLVIGLLFLLLTLSFPISGAPIRGGAHAFNMGLLLIGIITYLVVLAAFSLPLIMLFGTFVHDEKLRMRALIFILVLSLFIAHEFNPPAENFTKIPIPPGATEIVYYYTPPGFDNSRGLSFIFKSDLTEQQIYDFYLPYLKKMGLESYVNKYSSSAAGEFASFECTQNTGYITLHHRYGIYQFILGHDAQWPPC